MNVKVNKNGVNAKIKSHILSDERMKNNGFRKFNDECWSYYKILDAKNDISFSIDINMNDESDLRIDILDEEFGQPYDYQYMLERNPNFKIALDIRDKVEIYMDRLEDAGILTGHVRGEYI